MGILISLSGVDNAGKSTQSKLLVKHFQKMSKTVNVTEFAFGYYLLKPIVRRLRKVTNSPSGGPVARNTRLLPKLWFIPAFIDIWVGYLFHLLRLKRKHDVVICDRFYTDIWVNLVYYGYCPDWAFRILIGLLPKPEIAFVLLISPRSGHGRENDMFPITYYREQISLYKKLANAIDCTVIDVEKEPKQILKEIVEHTTFGK